MSDALNRAIRTFIQAFLGAIITSGVLGNISNEGVADWSALKQALVAALAAGVIAAITYTQNWLEEQEKIPKLLKK